MKRSRTSRLFVSLIISLSWFMLSVPMWAQKDTGSIVGTVKDGTGAVVHVQSMWPKPSSCRPGRPIKSGLTAPWHRDCHAEQMRLIAGETHSFTLDYSRFLLCRLCTSSRAGLSQNRAAERICRISMCAWLAKLIWT